MAMMTARCRDGILHALPSQYPDFRRIVGMESSFLELPCHDQTPFLLICFYCYTIVVFVECPRQLSPRISPTSSILQQQKGVGHHQTESPPKVYEFRSNENESKHEDSSLVHYPPRQSPTPRMPPVPRSDNLTRDVKHESSPQVLAVVQCLSRPLLRSMEYYPIFFLHPLSFSGVLICP